MPLFPDPQVAADPDGLVAYGGDLSVPTLLEAYTHGIFPWYNDDQPILWWSPDPRFVLFPEKCRVPRTVAKNFRRQQYHVTFDQCFADVIKHCAQLRAQSGTWITRDMQKAYVRMHQAGWAHSVEVWQADKLVGGLYGLALDRVFHGESMFSLAPDASKFALLHLCQQLAKQQFVMIDCQMETPHMLRMGGEALPREQYLSLIRQFGQARARQLALPAENP